MTAQDIRVWLGCGIGGVCGAVIATGAADGEWLIVLLGIGVVLTWLRILMEPM